MEVLHRIDLRDREAVAVGSEEAHGLEELACSLDFEGGPGMYDSGPFGEASGRPVPVAIETYTALKARQRAEEAASSDQLAHRAGLLNWDANEDPQ